MPDTSPSALLVRLDGIGDALALAPLLYALRRRNVRTGIVLQSRNADVFAPHAFDALHVAHFGMRDDSRKNRAAIASFAREELRPFAYDNALIATEDVAGYRMAFDAGIAQRIAFDNGWGKPLKTLWVRSRCTRTLRRTAGLDPRGIHECDMLFELGRVLLGAREAPTRDATILRALVLDDDTAPDARVAVQITQKWTRLGATIEDVLEVVRRLQRRHDLRLLAPADETPFVEPFERACTLRVERFDDVRAWKAAIGESAALVAPDSGAMHVAGMIGTPVVGAFPSSPHFALQVARWRPWAARHHIVRIEPAWPIAAADGIEDLLR